LVNLFVSNKLEGHPRLPKGAVGCMFVFTSKKEAMKHGFLEITEVSVPKHEFVQKGIDKVRRFIIKNSDKELVDDKKNKKKKEAK